MREELVRQLDRYDDVVRELEIARHYGGDPRLERGAVSSFIARLHPSRLSLVVRDTIDETPSTKTLRLTADSGYLPPFIAGQYIGLFVEVGNIRTSRAYSISSPPNQRGYFDITVRRVEEGLVSNYLLDDVATGDRLESSGPTGVFYHNPVIHSRDMVCLAGGSGITPFMSMIREIVQRGLDRRVYLFYGSRSEDDIIFHTELAAVAAKEAAIHYIPVIEQSAAQYSGNGGYITAELLKDVLKTPDDKTYFICGPTAMHDFCLSELAKLGVSRRRIRREVSGTPLRIREYPGWPETVSEDAEFTLSVTGAKRATLKAPASESILSVLEKNGIIVPSACRSGDCSMCRLKLTSGKVFQPGGTAVRRSDRQRGYIHSCVSYALEDCEILVH